MSLTIDTLTDPDVPTMVDPPATIASLATTTGNPPPAGFTAVGVTVPVININQAGLHYETRAGGSQFRFHHGVRRDTSHEYGKVERQVRIRCGRGLSGGALSQGMYGKGIDIVQNALNNSPPTTLAALKVDGIFGPATDARVREFQRNQTNPKLTDDGIVGPKTRAALEL